MNIARQFVPGSKQAERALQAYLILIGVAHNRQTITYWDLTMLMHGHGAPQTVPAALGRIVRFCERCGLPRLSVLVVDKITGCPGDTHIYDQVGIDAERQKVFACEWYRLWPPSLEDLQG